MSSGALEHNSFLLLLVKNIYLNKIKGSAKRISKKNQYEEVEYSTGINYAKERVRSSKDKLNGINPCVITVNDLVNGVHKDGKYTRAFINAACGLNAIDDKGDYEMLRTRLFKQKKEDYKLSIEEQVKCIIEQSMDLEILGRAWQGWEPFI